MVADRPTRVPVNEVQKRVEGHDPRCTRAPSPVASQNPPKAPGVPQHGRVKGSGRDEKKNLRHAFDTLVCSQSVHGTRS
jgi:hypothetical protein